jgi:very-short-patch-repair endonuclease
MKRKLTPLARNLRKRMTDAETKLWHHINRKSLGFKFRRQCPIGEYIVDFVSFDSMLVIEIDGSEHLDSKADVLRDEWLRSQGFKVLRFWDNEILDNIEGVLLRLSEELPPPSLPHEGGGGTERSSNA